MPLTPKSGEHDDHIAPIAVVESIATTDSEEFGMTPQTLSPGETPHFFILDANDST